MVKTHTKHTKDKGDKRNTSKMRRKKKTRFEVILNGLFVSYSADSQHRKKCFNGMEQSTIARYVKKVYGIE